VSGGPGTPDATERALLAGVLARPDEDEPRRVHADWLKERGDPRGTFIADQLTLAGLQETDPSWSEVYTRSERALHRHWRAWTAPLLGADQDYPGLPSATFRRGYVEEIVLAYEAPPGLLEGAPAPLRVATLLGMPVGPRRFFAEIARAGMGVDVRVGLAELGEMPPEDRARLVRLAVVFGVVGLDTAELLSGLLPGTLEHLALENHVWGQELGEVHTRLVDAGVLDTLPSLRLQDLHLGPDVLERLCERRSEVPVRLFVQNGRLGDADPGCGPCVPRLLTWRPLEALGLDAFGSDAIEVLLGGAIPPVLRALSLERAALSPASIGSLADLEAPSLTRLRLDGADVDDAVAAAVARSPVARQLVAIDLRYRVGDAGLLALLEAPIRPRAFSVGGRVGDRGVEALARWPGLAGVTELDLSTSDGIGDGGIRALIAAPGFDPVRLYLSGLFTISEPVQAELHERFGAALVLHNACYGGLMAKWQRLAR
jgi:uncharacterized protein (TIGR02996 family)